MLTLPVRITTQMGVAIRVRASPYQACSAALPIRVPSFLPCSSHQCFVRRVHETGHPQMQHQAAPSFQPPQATQRPKGPAFRHEGTEPGGDDVVAPAVLEPKLLGLKLHQRLDLAGELVQRSNHCGVVLKNRQIYFRRQQNGWASQAVQATEGCRTKINKR